MVANQPIERPDTVDFLVNKLNGFQREIVESARQSMYPMVVSHPDPVTQASIPDLQVIPDPDDPNGGSQVIISTGSGQVVFHTFYSTLYGGKVARMLDLSSNVMWNQDELAGYGISHPSMPIPTGPDSSGFGTASVANGLETSIGGGSFFAYNPAVTLGAVVRPTAATAYNFRWSVTTNTGTSYSSTVTGLTGGQYASATMLLPETAMSTLVKVNLLVTNTGGAQNFYYGHKACYGVSAAQYYLDNGLPTPR
ncbi:hypothetical protein AB0383_20660 [Amycolatopsis sp. NPDC051373]|uniref:hypothetical protein n=1 Tax=Amycolatopsis sp. NPDC051373 TaxID=3155801 RepID=UPI0034501702